MFLDCRQHILGDFKFMPNIYKSEDEFTIYYQSFIIGIIDTSKIPKIISITNNCLMTFDIINVDVKTVERTGTVTIEIYSIFNSNNKRIQKGRIHNVEFNINSVEKINNELINIRSVILEKLDKDLEFELLNSYFKVSKRIVGTYSRRQINYNFYRNDILIVDYPYLLKQ